MTTDDSTEPGWQVIETAPKDGTYMLLVSPAHGRVIGAYVVGDVWHLIGVGAVTSASERPTHWMPLPELPSSASTDRTAVRGSSGREFQAVQAEQELTARAGMSTPEDLIRFWREGARTPCGSVQQIRSQTLRQCAEQLEAALAVSEGIRHQLEQEIQELRDLSRVAGLPKPHQKSDLRDAQRGNPSDG
jgi:hypothetical protein